MNKRCLCFDPRSAKRQRFTDLSKYHMLAVGNTAWMTGEIAIKNINVSLRQNLPQMRVGPSIAKTKFENTSFQTGYAVCDGFKKLFLGCQTADKTVETAHNSNSILVEIEPLDNRHGC